MLPGQRDAIILQLLDQHGMVTVEEIGARCDCSLETARRDLRRLEGKGMLSRTYGGALRAVLAPSFTVTNNGGGLLEARAALVDRADALIVTPSETAATRILVERARRTGVPIIAESHSYPGATTVVAIDDYQAGVELGRWVADYARKNLDGRVHVLDVTASLANTSARSRGFSDGLRQLLPEQRSVHSIDGQGLREVARRIAADALAVHPEINVIFGVNDDSALGALEAYRNTGLSEKHLLVTSFGFEGKRAKNLMEEGGPYKAAVAMFPELVGRVCVDAAVCAYHRQPLPDRIFTPFAIITRETLTEYYHRNASDGEWQVDSARAAQLLRTNSLLLQLGEPRRQSASTRIGCVKIFSSHEWYQNVERAMIERASERGIAIEVVDASQDMALEVDALKKAIGITASRFINDGDTVIIDAGITTRHLAEALAGRRGIRVITNSLPVLAELGGVKGIDLVSTGGEVRHESLSLVGPGAETTLRELRADKAFLGGAGLSVEFGLSNSNIAEAAVKQTMIKAARKVILLADHTKIGLESLVKIAPLNNISMLITDPGISAHDRAAFTQGGVDVIIAEN